MPVLSSAADTMNGWSNPASHPDLSGAWVIEKNLLYSLIPTDGKGIPVQAWAYAIAARSLQDARDGKPPVTNNRVCLPIGPAREMQSVWPFMILQTPEQVTFLMEENSRTYFVYLNQDHPKDLRPSWNGDSVGHWEGDTLVVDTLGMNDKTPMVANTRTEIPHTEAMHLIRRYRLIDGGRRLENHATIDDPNAFTRPFEVITTYVRLEPTDRILEQICSQNYIDYGAKSQNSENGENSEKRDAGK
jgi:hypothetical protein